jgi:hypothetical protein
MLRGWSPPAVSDESTFCLQCWPRHIGGPVADPKFNTPPLIDGRVQFSDPAVSEPSLIAPRPAPGIESPDPNIIADLISVSIRPAQAPGSRCAGRCSAQISRDASSPFPGAIFVPELDFVASLRSIAQFVCLRRPSSVSRDCSFAFSSHAREGLRASLKGYTSEPYRHQGPPKLATAALASRQIPHRRGLDGICTNVEWLHTCLKDEIEDVPLATTAKRKKRKQSPRGSRSERVR